MGVSSFVPPTTFHAMVDDSMEIAAEQGHNTVQKYIYISIDLLDVEQDKTTYPGYEEGSLIERSILHRFLPWGMKDKCRGSDMSAPKSPCGEKEIGKWWWIKFERWI